MPTPAPALKLTYDDYVLFPEDGNRHEILDGEHHVSPSPIRRHQVVSVRLTLVLGSFVQDRALGQLFVAPFDVVLSEWDVVQPDLLFISNERASIVTEQNVQGAPDLVIEILSEGTRKADEVTKRKLYERFGVREYWVVDPLLETIKVYRPESQVFRRVSELSVEAGDRLETPLLPGLGIHLAQIFA